MANNRAMKIISVLPWIDWLAVASLFLAWYGYARFAGADHSGRSSILGTTNRYRKLWMLQTTLRDPRMLDGLIAQSLANMPAFFSSTTIIIIGGLFALLGSTQEATQLVSEIPFAARTSVLVFDLKVIVLIAIFTYAFFRFTWAMRQNSFVALLIGSMPPVEEFKEGQADREAHAARASKLLSLSAETFNDGLRAYYFAFATMAWFISPFAMLAATAFVIVVLYNREFRSAALEVLHAE